MMVVHTPDSYSTKNLDVSQYGMQLTAPVFEEARCERCKQTCKLVSPISKLQSSTI